MFQETVPAHRGPDDAPSGPAVRTTADQHSSRVPPNSGTGLASLFDRYSAIDPPTRGQREELAEGVRSFAWRIAKRYQRSDADCDDISNEATSRVFTQLESSNFTIKKSFVSFVFSVVYKANVDFLRSGKRANRMDAVFSAIASPAPESPLDTVTRTEDAEVVRRAIGQLSPFKQNLVSLHYFQGLTYLQIAAQLDIRLEKVKNHLHGARLELKSILQQGYGSQAASGQPRH